MDMPVKPPRTQDQLDAEHSQVAQSGAPPKRETPAQSGHHTAALHAQSSERSISPNDVDSVANTIENTGAFVKNGAVGIDAHRIVPHRYEIRSIEPSPVDPKTGKARTTSVGGIFDPEGVTDRGVVGDYKVRFDQSHPSKKGPTGPHINFGRGEHLALPMSEAVIQSAGVAARALEGLDHVAIPVGIAVDSARLENAALADGKIGEHVIDTAGSVVGGWAGGILGAAATTVVTTAAGRLAGAEVGAAFGVATGGPIGAAIGAVVGGIGGGVAGSFGGSWIGEHAREAYMHVRYGGNERPITPGYQQSGTITSVQAGIVTQDTGRSCVEYKMADLLAHTHDPAAMKNALVPGNAVTISIDRDQQVNVTTLERSHNLEQAHRSER